MAGERVHELDCFLMQTSSLKLLSGKYICSMNLFFSVLTSHSSLMQLKPQPCYVYLIVLHWRLLKFSLQKMMVTWGCPCGNLTVSMTCLSLLSSSSFPPSCLILIYFPHSVAPRCLGYFFGFHLRLSVRWVDARSHCVSYLARTDSLSSCTDSGRCLGLCHMMHCSSILPASLVIELRCIRCVWSLHFQPFDWSLTHELLSSDMECDV